jgi:hypothetical protein
MSGYIIDDRLFFTYLHLFLSANSENYIRMMIIIHAQSMLERHLKKSVGLSFTIVENGSRIDS